MKKTRIALFGGGVVATGLWRLLEERGDLPYEIVIVAVKDLGRERAIPSHLLTSEHEQVWRRQDIDIVVEAISDSAAAFEIAQQSLSRQLPLITASKKMVADRLIELASLLDTTETTIRCEAAVCAEIPILHALTTRPNGEVREIKGIFNGTSNYILTQMSKRGISYEMALVEAKKAGFAESDPSSDVGGFDAAYKSVILGSLAFETLIRPEDVLTIGIAQITGQDIQEAGANEQRIKQVARVIRTPSGPRLLVMPSFIDSSSPLYSIDDETNIVLVDRGDGLEELVGRGAGGEATALGILADLDALGRCEGSTIPSLSAEQNDPTEQTYSLQLDVTLKGPAAVISPMLYELNATHFNAVDDIATAIGRIDFDRLVVLADGLLSQGVRIIQSGPGLCIESLEADAQYSIH